MPFETKAKMLAERLSRNVAGEFEVAESGREGREIKREEGEEGGWGDVSIHQRELAEMQMQRQSYRYS